MEQAAEFLPARRGVLALPLHVLPLVVVFVAYRKRFCTSLLHEARL